MRLTPTLLAATGLALSLAACGQDQPAPVDSEVTAGPESDRSLADPAPAAVTAPAAQTPSTAGPAIPAAMLGVWDAVTGSCDPASDLRLEIGPRSIEFYESMGTITNIELADDGRIVDMDMEGEGETWTQRTTLTLDEAEDRLTLENADAPANARTIPRKRCPA